MIVPHFWAESRLQHRAKGRQTTVCRFGWSDTSQEDAQAHADTRVKEAFERILRGEKLDRREFKTPYNGAQGIPIREEIVARHADTVITRNTYGARCLNSPNVLFADIDYVYEASPIVALVVGLALLVLAGMGVWTGHSRALSIVSSVVFAINLLVLRNSLFRLARYVKQMAAGGPEQIARQRLAAFVEQNPEWNLNVYRTPAGLRVMALHRLFDPQEAAVTAFFDAIGTDPVYAVMCKNQHCFRARVSAKPWRIGIPDHIRPRPGVWPVAAKHLPRRNEWIEAYEKAASAYAACTFRERLGGSTAVHPVAQEVMELHDALSHAHDKHPIA